MSSLYQNLTEHLGMEMVEKVFMKLKDDDDEPSNKIKTLGTELFIAKGTLSNIL